MVATGRGGIRLPDSRHGAPMIYPGEGLYARATIDYMGLSDVNWIHH